MLRPTLQAKHTILALVLRLIDLIAKQSAVNKLWIVDEAGVRIRGEDD